MRGADGGGHGLGRADGAAPLNRRALLRAGAFVAVAGPVLAACTTRSTPPPPDPLQRLLTAATRDAATAKAAATAFADNGPTLAVIATVRGQQAAALRKEVYRAAGGPPSATPTPASGAPSTTPPLPAEATVTAQLQQGLTAAQQEATTLMPRLPRYRAGLVGSVAAGCASLAEALDSKPITATSARSAPPAASGGSPTLTSPAATASGTPATTPKTAPLAKDTATALQNALAAANAALWLYGTASAYLTASVLAETVAAMQAVQNLRDATAAVLTAGGGTPRPAQPAYLVPTPITSQPTALAALGNAESGAALAWRTVLEHTDQRTLRTAGLNALIDSAVRQTRWRRLSGQSPASVALPGAAA